MVDFLGTVEKLIENRFDLIVVLYSDILVGMVVGTVAGVQTGEGVVVLRARAVRRLRFFLVEDVSRGLCWSRICLKETDVD